MPEIPDNEVPRDIIPGEPEPTAEHLRARLQEAFEGVVTLLPDPNHERVTHLRNVIQEVGPRLRLTTEELREKFGDPDGENGGGGR